MSRGATAPDGATRVSQNGYHYTKRNGKWELTHRIVAEEQILHRPLEQTERVEFKNKNKMDFRPENLRVATVKADTHTLERRKAELEAKRDEINAQISYIEEELHKQRITNPA